MRRISRIFAEKYRGTCRRDSGNSGNFFAASREKRTPRVSLFVFYSIKEKIDFSRRGNKCGDKEEEGGERARTAGSGATRKQGQRECKGNDKKEGRRREVEGGGKAKGL